MPLLFNFSLEYAIRRVPVNQEGLKLNATHHLPVYVYDNILGGSILIYLGTTLTNQNFIHEDNKSRLKSGNAYYHWVQNFLFSSLLSKNINIKIYRTICWLFCIEGGM